jgi:hypothetical protein
MPHYESGGIFVPNPHDPIQAMVAEFQAAVEANGDMLPLAATVRPDVKEPDDA